MTKTAFWYGRQYAKHMARTEGCSEPVDINEMVNSSMDMPEGDYLEMKQKGIMPDARQYWKGYNSYFE